MNVDKMEAIYRQFDNIKGKVPVEYSIYECEKCSIAYTFTFSFNKYENFNPFDYVYVNAFFKIMGKITKFVSSDIGLFGVVINVNNFNTFDAIVDKLVGDSFNRLIEINEDELYCITMLHNKCVELLYYDVSISQLLDGMSKYVSGFDIIRKCKEVEWRPVGMLPEDKLAG